MCTVLVSFAFSLTYGSCDSTALAHLSAKSCLVFACQLPDAVMHICTSPAVEEAEGCSDAFFQACWNPCLAFVLLHPYFIVEQETNANRAPLRMQLGLLTHNQRQLVSTDVKGVFVVEAEAAAQFMHDVGKVNTAEAGLHLLTAVLSQPSASRDAVAATEANALQVLSGPRPSTCTCCGSPSSSLLSTCLTAICLQSTHCRNPADHTSDCLQHHSASRASLKHTVIAPSQVVSLSLLPQPRYCQVPVGCAVYGGIYKPQVCSSHDAAMYLISAGT